MKNGSKIRYTHWLLEKKRSVYGTLQIKFERKCGNRSAVLEIDD